MGAVSILAALTHESDRKSLEKIVKDANWSVEFAENYDDLARALVVGSFDVVISEADLGDGRDWKCVLDVTQSMRVQVPLIVTDRLGEERLWAEILNLGAYDLLLQPFNSTEVFRIVGSACQAAGQHTLAMRAATVPAV